MTKLCEIHSQHPAIGCTIYALHVTLYGTVPAVSIPSAANTWHNQICSSRQVSPRTNLMVQNTCCRMYGHRSMVRRNGGWWDVNASHVLEWKWAQNFLHNIAAPDRLLRSSTCFLAQLLFRKKISYPIKKKKDLWIIIPRRQRRRGRPEVSKLPLPSSSFSLISGLKFIMFNHHQLVSTPTLCSLVAIFYFCVKPRRLFPSPVTSGEERKHGDSTPSAT